MPEVEIRLLDRFGAPITDLPDANLEQAHWVLSESGDASFAIDPMADGADQIKQWDTEVQIWWDGDLRWWGIPLNFSGGPGGVTVTCEGLLSWFKKRIVDVTTLMYGDAEANSFLDQFVIGWNLVAYAQNESTQANRDCFIDASNFTNSGIQRSAIYKREEHKLIYDILQEFRKFYQGFEFEVVVTGDGGRFWTPYYPRKGQARSEYQMIYTAGEDRNIVSFSWSEDGMNMVTDDFNTGGTVLGQKIEERYQDTEASSRHGVLQGVQSSGSELDRAWLQSKARHEVEARKEATPAVTVTSVETEDLSMFGTLDTGDWIPITIDYGMIQVDAYHRVSEITWSRNETLVLALSESVVV